MFAVRLRDDVKDYTVFDISDRLRMRGWLVPAYHMPPDIEDMAVLRVVVRNGFGRDLAGLLDRRSRTGDRVSSKSTAARPT